MSSTANFHIRIRWYLPALGKRSIVINQRPADRINDESVVILAAANHL